MGVNCSGEVNGAREITSIVGRALCRSYLSEIIEKVDAMLRGDCEFILGEGYTSRSLEGPEMRVDSLAVMPNDDCLPSLIGGEENRHLQLLKDVGQIRGEYGG
jgi:hypothetical protein